MGLKEKRSVVKRMRRFLNFLSVLVLLSGFSHSIPDAHALSVEEYIQLTLEIFETSVGEWNERLSLTGQTLDEASRRAALEGIARKYEGIRGTLYTKYGTSSGGYLDFIRENGEAVRSYLENHEESKDSLDQATGRVNSLISQFESAVNR